MTKKILNLMLALLMFASFAKAQTAEVSVALNEQFFDALLDAIFKNFSAPEFPLAKNQSTVESRESRTQNRSGRADILESKPVNFIPGESRWFEKQRLESNNRCNDVIRLQREIDGVRTAVRFREGKIYAPIAFAGSYNPPLIGCVDFQGWAETNIDLEFNRQSQKLVGRVRVLSVNLGGMTNLASGVLSRLVQSAIDKKINPVEILNTEKLSFVVPLQNANGSLKMKVVGVRHEISNGVLNINVAYEFAKGN